MGDTKRTREAKGKNKDEYRRERDVERARETLDEPEPDFDELLEEPEAETADAEEGEEVEAAEGEEIDDGEPVDVAAVEAGLVADLGVETDETDETDEERDRELEAQLAEEQRYEQEMSEDTE